MTDLQIQSARVNPDVAGAVSVTLCPAAAWPNVADVWHLLERGSPYATFFLSRAWVESWLATFADAIPLDLVVFRAGTVPVAACLMVRRLRRHGPFRLRRLFLNTSGEDPGDGPYIEFNNLLCLAGWEKRVCQALHEHICRQSWDEFILNGFCQGPPLDALRGLFPDALEKRVIQKNYFLDLAKLRDSHQPYESVLRTKTRTRIRRFFKDYGQITVAEAQTLDAALQMLDELAGLHQQTWSNRGEQGAFASKRFVSFHRTLIQRTFVAGAIQLVRVSAGQTVGLLYNFVHDGKVYFYQSGFNYTACPGGKPGFVTIVSVIRHCLNNPALKEFQFMPGGDEYKEPLATGCDEQEWIVFKSRSWRNRLISRVQRLKKRFAALIQKKTLTAGEIGQSSVPGVNDPGCDGGD